MVPRASLGQISREDPHGHRITVWALGFQKLTDSRKPSKSAALRGRVQLRLPSKDDWCRPHFQWVNLLIDLWPPCQTNVLCHCAQSRSSGSHCLREPCALHPGPSAPDHKQNQPFPWCVEVPWDLLQGISGHRSPVRFSRGSSSVPGGRPPSLWLLTFPAGRNGGQQPPPGAPSVSHWGAQGFSVAGIPAGESPELCPSRTISWHSHACRDAG